MSEQKIDWETKFKVARDEFLSLLADGKWEIEYDADTSDTGRPIDCSSYQIEGGISSLLSLCHALDIREKFYGQAPDEFITEAIEEPAFVPPTKE